MDKGNYTFNMLFNDIQADSTDGIEIHESVYISNREYKSKLMVVQMLLGLAESYKTENYNNNEKLRNSIETIVDGDEQLSGYIFFVSQNPQFDYSWHYMRKCRTNYIEFLVNSIRFFNNVLNDINLLISKPWSEKNIHVVFHEILDVALTSEEPFVKARLLWKNFYRLAMVKSDYNIIVKAKDTLLKAASRKDPSDMKSIIDFLNEMENNKSNEISENETV